MTYVCDVCGWEYNEEEGAPEYGIAPGTKWEDLPDDFECPLCAVGKDQFSKKDWFHNSNRLLQILSNEQSDFRSAHLIISKSTKG